ncbi:hypothetical protein GNI_141050 [Gregarina niphandrodes]|uniref:Uncharacterized protein n=1 Tax=Gregarina niphandrodes TaxID=110365 RepID=A0A023B094_GRENI|nr:hypothetical protein GNI_141050 [Gregarina niphandrodes]EZG45070.1 hypothetical protein GNI_141050 [Gregarina niphandrodes]|eukprot:XP_011132574.1 hypothetical protein GNI_141050 [Gregarina niphandrodes]
MALQDRMLQLVQAIDPLTLSVIRESDVYADYEAVLNDPTDFTLPWPPMGGRITSVLNDHLKEAIKEMYTGAELGESALEPQLVKQLDETRGSKPKLDRQLGSLAPQIPHSVAKVAVALQGVPVKEAVIVDSSLVHAGVPVVKLGSKDPTEQMLQLVSRGYLADEVLEDIASHTATDHVLKSVHQTPDPGPTGAELNPGSNPESSPQAATEAQTKTASSTESHPFDWAALGAFEEEMRSQACLPWYMPRYPEPFADTVPPGLPPPVFIEGIAQACEAGDWLSATRQFLEWANEATT